MGGTLKNYFLAPTKGRSPYEPSQQAQIGFISIIGGYATAELPRREFQWVERRRDTLPVAGIVGLRAEGQLLRHPIAH